MTWQVMTWNWKKLSQVTEEGNTVLFQEFVTGSTEGVTIYCLFKNMRKTGKSVTLSKKENEVLKPVMIKHFL